MINKFPWKQFILLVSIFFLGLFALFIPHIIGENQQFGEYYILHIYPYVTAPLVSFTSLFPFSLTEVLVVFSAITGIFWIILFFMCLKKSGNRKVFLYRFFVIIICLFTLNAFTYTLFHGMAYTRLPLQNSLGLDTEKRSVEELREVVEWLLTKTAEKRAVVSEDETGCMTLSTDITTALHYGSDALDSAAVMFPAIEGNEVNPKPVYFSHLWSYTGIVGMYFPFFGEANVNVDSPDLSLPFTICHEIAHVRGVAREEDANLVGFLACMASDRDDFQYCGYQYALVYCMNDLYHADPEYHKELYQKIPEGTLRDWSAKNAYWDQFEGPVEETSEKINDSFLKANQQELGVRSYDQVTNLIISYYFSYVKGADHAKGDS
jgi:hypothetical protein